MPNNEKQEKRYEELHKKAVNAYLNKTDWDISEWLTKSEYREYRRLEREG